MITDFRTIECKDDDIAFTKVKLPFGWMQNMARFEVIYKGHIFKTTEHLFQAMRFEFESETFLLIKNTTSPFEAKQLAHKNKDHMIMAMMADHDLNNMDECVRLKLDQHPELQTKLIKTKKRELVEDVTNRPYGSAKFWGAAKEGNVWVGENALGVIWMSHRDRLNEC